MFLFIHRFCKIRVYRNLYDNIYILFLNFILKCLIQKKPLYNRNYKIVICGIFKNEAPFLKEWIEYHQLIGVEHFYLYNNNSDDGFEEVLKPYIQKELVTLIDWPYNQAQVQAYKNFYENYRNQTQWVSFLDLDEFIVPKYTDSLIEWLKKWEKYPAILMNWKMFGTSGIMKHDFSKLVIEQYHICSKNIYKIGKCLINTDYDMEFSLNGATIHYPTLIYRNRFFSCRVFPITFSGFFSKYGEDILFDKTTKIEPDVQINHYWSKAWDIYSEKQRRSDVFFRNNPKKGNEHFIFHENQCGNCDYTIYRFITRLKLKMKKDI